jgi:hypothetical protein
MANGSLPLAAEENSAQKGTIFSSVVKAISAVLSNIP